MAIETDCRNWLPQFLPLRCIASDLFLLVSCSRAVEKLQKYSHTVPHISPVDRTPERHLLVRVGIGQLRHFFPSPPARHAREPRGVAAFREGSPPSSSSPVVRDGAAPRLRFPCAQTRRESLPSSSTFPAERARRLQRAALAAACHPQGWTITLGSRGVPLGFISQLIALRLAGKHCPPVIGTPYRT